MRTKGYLRIKAISRIYLKGRNTGGRISDGFDTGPGFFLLTENANHSACEHTNPTNENCLGFKVGPGCQGPYDYS